MKCDNNKISTNSAEDALLSFTGEHVLKFQNVKAVVERVKKRFEQSTPDLRPLEKSLAKFEKEQHLLTELYKKGLVEIDDIEKEMLAIKEQKKTIIENIKEKKASQGVVKVSDDEIKHAIDHLTEEMRLADGNAQKMAFQALFDEVKLHPKKANLGAEK